MRGSRFRGGLLLPVFDDVHNDDGDDDDSDDDDDDDDVTTSVSGKITLICFVL